MTFEVLNECGHGDRPSFQLSLINESIQRVKRTCTVPGWEGGAGGGTVLVVMY